MTLLLLAGLVFAGIGGTRLLHIYLTSTGRQAADVPSKQDYPVRGVDAVSDYQGNIDWDVLASQDVDFCFIKATEGVGRGDSQFAAELVEAARVAGDVAWVPTTSSGSRTRARSGRKALCAECR